MRPGNDAPTGIDVASKAGNKLKLHAGINTFIKPGNIRWATLYGGGVNTLNLKYLFSRNAIDYASYGDIFVAKFMNAEAKSRQWNWCSRARHRGAGEIFEWPKMRYFRRCDANNRQNYKLSLNASTRCATMHHRLNTRRISCDDCAFIIDTQIQ